MQSSLNENQFKNKGIRSPLIWITAGIVLGLAGLLGLIAVAAYVHRHTPVPDAAPVITVLPGTTRLSPTHTEIPRRTSAPQISTQTGTPDVGPALALDILVEVYGTGGEGLRIRELAGISYPIQYLGLDQEVFQITDGPVNADGYVWWKLVNPYNPNVSGWAVSNYLKPLDRE
jgi:hypothetical protein